MDKPVPTAHPLVPLWAVAFNAAVSLSHRGAEWTASISTQAGEGQGYSPDRSLRDLERTLSAKMGHVYWEKLLAASFQLTDMDPDGTPGGYVPFWKDSFKVFGQTHGFERVPVELSCAYFQSANGADLEDLLPYITPKQSFLNRLSGHGFITMMEDTYWREALCRQTNKQDPDCGFYQAIGMIFPGPAVELADPILLDRIMQVSPAPTNKAYSTVLTTKRTEPIVSAMIRKWGVPNEISIVQLVRANMNKAWSQLVSKGYQASDTIAHDLVRFGQYEKLAQVSTPEQRSTQARLWATDKMESIKQQNLGSKYAALHYLLNNGAVVEEVSTILAAYPAPKDEKNILRRESLSLALARRKMESPPLEVMTSDLDLA